MQDSETAALLARINSRSKITPMAGVFVSYGADGGVVDIGSGRITAAFGTLYIPEPSESVLVWFVDGAPYIMGPAIPRPAGGTVTKVESGRVTMDTPVGVVGPLPYFGSAPVVGQTLRIMWHGGGVAFAATDSIIPAPPAPPAPPPTSTHVDTFTAVSAGTWASGADDTADGPNAYTGEVVASPNNIAAWFFGTKIADTIPSGAAIQRVEMYVSARQILYAPPNLTLHDRTAPPLISLSGGTAVGLPNNAWVDLPAGWGNNLKAGGGAYGIGVRKGGFNIFKSLAQDGMSGALRITSVY